MQLKQLELAGGGTLTVYLRDCCERMPNVLDRPLVLVVPGGGYTHVSAREGDPGKKRVNQQQSQQSGFC